MGSFQGTVRTSAWRSRPEELDNREAKAAEFGIEGEDVARVLFNGELSTVA